MEPALYAHLNRAVRTREAYAKRLARAGSDEEDEDDAAVAEQTARETAAELTTALRAFDRNRNKVTGDKRTPRKRTAGTAPTDSGEQSILELQSMRRGILALVEVGKLVGCSFPPLRFAY